MKPKLNLVEFFKSEHQALMVLFEPEYAKAKINHDWRPLLLLCEDMFEKNHHAKEEKYIFESVRKNKQIRGGGPLCTYFFDSHVKEPNLRKAIEMTRKLTGQVLNPAWSDQMMDIREKNLPLVIPGEDHEAGRLLLRGIEILLSGQDHNKGNNDKSDPNKIEILFQTYIEIQRIHFDREENCFFRMCKDLISPETWDQILCDMSKNYPEIRISG